MEFFRGVPLVMVIFWMWFILPQVLGLALPEYGIALTAFVIFEAAYFGEIVRAGVQSVSGGQVEAARALGLTGAQGMAYVILPQALRNMVPALVTQMIVLFKDTSLASIIGYVDLTKAAQIVNNREIKPFELYLFIAVVYWICTYSMSRLARRMERPAESCVIPRRGASPLHPLPTLLTGLRPVWRARLSTTRAERRLRRRNSLLGEAERKSEPAARSF